MNINYDVDVRVGVQYAFNLTFIKNISSESLCAFGSFSIVAWWKDNLFTVADVGNGVLRIRKKRFLSMDSDMEDINLAVFHISNVLGCPTGFFRSMTKK